MEINELLDKTVKSNASDLHLLVGIVPTLRIDGELVVLSNYQALTETDVEQLVFAVLTVKQKEMLLTNREIDLSFQARDSASVSGRFRVNAYYQRRTLACEFRYLPGKIRSIEELNLPKILHEFTTLRQGFILVTGPTGHGKSTTLASLVQEINLLRTAHILTIEDPIEYTYQAGKSIISQREMGSDTYSWNKALRSALREDPDVVLIGEMRDVETISSAITIAETGHLVFSTLHTNSASQTVDRIVDTFPEHQQEQIRLQLSSTLEGVISQRLVPAIGGGRIPVLEILLATDAVRTNIREGKTYLIENIIRTSSSLGMTSLDESLATLVKTGRITLSTAQSFSLRPAELMRLIS